MASSKRLPTSHAEAIAALDGRVSRKLMHNTAVVVFYDDGRIKLNTEGWRTVTTKDRLNRCLPYPWRVASDARKGGWGLYENGERLTHFSDHMELRPNHAGILRPWRGGAA